MGKYIKTFETRSDYEAFIQTDYDKPNVSYCIETQGVYYNPIMPVVQPLSVTYNVEDASSPTQLYLYSFTELPVPVVGAIMFDKVEIDGVEVAVEDLDASEGKYNFSVGEHTVAYTLKDPTIVGIEANLETMEAKRVGATFYSCHNITNVEIPNSVTYVGVSAFSDCTSLTSIDIPDSVTSIGTAAFYGCTSLTNINIPNSVTSIGDAAFCSNAPLDESIKAAIASINPNAFGECESQ